MPTAMIGRAYGGRRGGVGGGGGGGGGAWSPLSLSSLAAWWDFSDTDTITDTANDIDAVTDKSGNGNDLSGSGSRPSTNTATINGLNTCDVNAAELLTIPSGVLTGGSAPFYVAAVVYFEDYTPTNYHFWLGYGTTTTRRGINLGVYPYVGEGNAVMDNYADNHSSDYAAVPNQTACFFEAWYDGGTGAVRHIAIDGVEILSPDSLGTALNIAQTYRYLGQHVGGSHQTNCRIGEVVMCNATQSAGTRASFASYVYDKWACPGLYDYLAQFRYAFEVDRSVMDGKIWQESSKTTAADADADPVGAIENIGTHADAVAGEIIQATSTKRLQLDINTRSIFGDGVDDIMLWNIDNHGLPYTAFFVFKGVVELADAFNVKGTGGRLRTQTSGGTHWDDSVNDIDLGNTQTDTQIVMIRVESASVGYWSVDGGSETSFDPYDSTGLDYLSLAGRATDANYSTSKLIALFGHDGAITGATLTSVINALKARFPNV